MIEKKSSFSSGIYLFLILIAASLGWVWFQTSGNKAWKAAYYHGQILTSNRVVVTRGNIEVSFIKSSLPQRPSMGVWKPLKEKTTKSEGPMNDSVSVSSSLPSFSGLKGTEFQDDEILRREAGPVDFIVYLLCRVPWITQLTGTDSKSHFEDSVTLSFFHNDERLVHLRAGSLSFSGNGVYIEDVKKNQVFVADKRLYFVLKKIIEDTSTG